MANPTGPGAPNVSSTSVDPLKRLRKLETDGAGELAQLRAEGVRTLAALREEAEAAVAQARAQAERDAEQALLKAQEDAEAAAQEIVREGDQQVEAVLAAPVTHILERQDAILDVVLGEFLSERPPPEE